MSFTREDLRTAILATIEELGYIDLAGDAESDRDLPLVVMTIAKHLGFPEESTEGLALQESEEQEERHCKLLKGDET